jgi:hypothetical protein
LLKAVVSGSLYWVSLRLLVKNLRLRMPQNLQVTIEVPASTTTAAFTSINTLSVTPITIREFKPLKLITRHCYL